MGYLLNGVWHDGWYETAKTGGEFVRPESAFRHRITADVRAVYHGHFKCNLRRIEDYPDLSGYLRELYQIPGVAETVNLDHIKRHYYMSHQHINPSRIVPVGPLLDFERPHGRERFAAHEQG